MKNFKELREGAENYTVKKGPYTRKVDGKTADKMKRQGWKLVAREEVEESVDLEERQVPQFVVKYAKSKRGPIYQTKFQTEKEAEKFLAQKKKEGMNGIISKGGKPVSMQKMADLQKESVELSEAPDLEKMSNELLKLKSKGIDYEKAAAYVRTMFMNSSLSVQDKAMKGLLTLLKNMDLKDRTTITKILKDNGFKVKGGQLMRESVELDEKTTIDLAREVVKKKSAKYGLDMQTANLIIQVYDKVNDVNKKKMEKMNPSALGQAVWKMTGK